MLSSSLLKIRGGGKKRKEGDAIPSFFRAANGTEEVLEERGGKKDGRAVASCRGGAEFICSAFKSQSRGRRERKDRGDGRAATSREGAIWQGELLPVLLLKGSERKELTCQRIAHICSQLR